MKRTEAAVAPERGTAARSVAIGFLALSASAAFAEVTFEPKIGVGVSTTDNVTLVATDKESETVYQLVPEFTLAGKGERLTTDVAYRGEVYRYTGRKNTEVFNLLNGQTSIALDPDNFFIKLRASRDRVTKGIFAPIPRSNLPLSANRIDRDDVSFGPSLRYSLGGNTTARADYTRSRVRYGKDDASLGLVTPNYDESVLGFSFDNYAKETGFSWATRYTSNKTEYDLFAPYEYRRATVELGSWVGSGFRVFAGGGLESAWDTTDPSLKDSFWELGFATKRKGRFNVEVAAGERSFGSSRRAKLDFTFMHGTTSASYSEEPTAHGRDPYSVAGRSLLPEVAADLLTNVYNPERYLSKRLQWSMQFDLRRTSVSLHADREARDDRVRLDGIRIPDEKQRGASISVGRHLGPRTEISLRGEVLNLAIAGGDDRDLKTAALRATHNLGSRTALVVEYSRSKEDGLDPSLNYSANLATVLLTRTF